ncbi:protease complex subunit PrcB family protein [Thermoactinomyces sp. CICC 10523]|uniref:protease complex subunit PrcB family protein n=1 Tax=Thermoactinomyces sp. CICC 10523 TaxID=2767428 RepID=UPI0018DD40D4|nr:protease complex subunit PrcB family protein [Thermoactinomyces sp. CICC 10523]MBH8597163.1 protease complex subunit PrcB family protein [Thermoactinomyces sp. CICC 10523]
MRKLIALMPILLLMTSCQIADAPGLTGGLKMEEPKENITFHTIEPSGLPEEIQKQVNQKLATPKKQAVLFHEDSRHFALITLGERKTAGYTITVDQVVRRGNTVTVYATEKTPAKGSFAAQVITHPSIIITFSAKQPVQHLEVKWAQS